MVSSHTAERHIELSALDQQRANRSLARASWLIVGLFAAMALTFWLAPAARVNGHLRILRIARLAFVLEFFALIGLVVVLRRRLGAQIRRVADHLDLLIKQNARLVESNTELEEQAELQQTQALELESQTAEIETRAAALEATNASLQASERRQQQLADELRLLSGRLTEAQHVANLGYWEIDSDTGKVFWSEEMYRLAGLEPDVGMPPTDRFLMAVHPEDRERMHAVASNAIAELREFTEQYRIVLPGQPTRIVQSKGRLVVDAVGRRKLVGTVQDITERLQLETQLRQAQKMDAIGKLAGGVAHDFNNVLTVIEGYTTLLLANHPADNPKDEDRAYIEEVRDAARRAAALTRQLLAFSRQQVLQPRVLSVNETLSGVEVMLRRLIGENIEFHTQLAGEVDFVKADPSQLEQVLVNLVVNARDAMPNGGVLTIETANVVLDHSYTWKRPNQPSGPHVMLAVTDTGIGIPAEDIDRIFDPFFTTKEAGKGTGLGLSTVHGIVEQSGGHVWVYSEPGRGTSFKVYLPRSNETDSGDKRTERTESARVGSETVLLVEDDPVVRKMTARVLKRAGYTVIEASDGLEALRMCNNPDTQFNLVLSDMVMPALGGRDLANHVSRLRPGIPTLLMSGYTRDAVLHSAGMSATEAFIEKPFTPDTLTAKVREVLDRAASQRN
ncbi:MAG TPA: ATP-binding protein [Gemmatimonadaceae bacterium]|nr:ATP-binding protein [Gemmatimonadaceae bacterium]